MEVGDTTNDLALPKEKDPQQHDEIDLFNVKNLTTVLKDLTVSEKNMLELMIDTKDQDLLTILKSAGGELTENVLSLIRRKVESSSEEMKCNDDVFESALETLSTNTEAAVKASTNAIVKLLQNLKKRPDQLKSRRHRIDNIIVKKYIMDVAGAVDFMKAVGFCETQSEKAIKYLEIEAATVDPSKIDHAIMLLETRVQESAKARVSKPPAEKTKCAGGCGFWGDEAQENYCSLCYKNKMCGIKPAAPEKPEKCTKLCGFFGAKKFDGMCSVCFSKTNISVKPASHASSWRRKFKNAIVKIKAMRSFQQAPRLLQKNKKRCWKCKRKVGLLGIECKCGFVFCGNHRYAEEHKCTFDHKGTHQKKLRKDNQQVIAKKFEAV